MKLSYIYSGLRYSAHIGHFRWLPTMSQSCDVLIILIVYTGSTEFSILAVWYEPILQTANATSKGSKPLALEYSLIRVFACHQSHSVEITWCGSNFQVYPFEFSMTVFVPVNFQRCCRRCASITYWRHINVNLNLIFYTSSSPLCLSVSLSLSLSLSFSLAFACIVTCGPITNLAFWSKLLG